jgi:peptidoglycan/xylan/chitin deacetylase (PgdA/CDA1 family)
MKTVIGLICLSVAVQTGRAAVGVEISPRAVPVTSEKMTLPAPQVAKSWWQGRWGSEYILEQKRRVGQGNSWDTYSFVAGAGNPTRRSLIIDDSQSYFRVFEMPTTGRGSNVAWRFRLLDLATGMELNSNTVLQCTGRVYFLEKPNKVITATNWFLPVNYSYDTPGRKEARIDVEYPGGATSKEWAVMVTNAVEDLMMNGGFELGSSNTATYWIKGGFGNNIRTHSIVQGRSGSRAAEVTMSNKVGSGDVRWQPTNMTVIPGGRYRLSYWYKSSVSNNVTASYVLAGGGSSFPGVALPPPAAEWTYIEHHLVVPTNAVSVSPYVALTTNGWLVIDDVKLVKLSDRSTLDEGLITFYIDDGWRVSGTNVALILEKYDYRGTYAITTDRVGHPDILSWSAMRSMQDNGHSFVAHTLDHSSMTNVHVTNMVWQINESRRIMRANGLRPVDSMVYPFGGRNALVDSEVRDAGYMCAMSTDSGYNLYGNYNPYALKRMTIYSTTTVAEVKGWIDEAVSGKKWLAVAWHRVGDGDTSVYSWPKASVEEVVAYARSKNLRSVSPEDGLRLLSE